MECISLLASSQAKIFREKNRPGDEANITVYMAYLVFVLCQRVHSCIELSLYGIDFFVEIFLWRLPRNVIRARVH